MHYLYFYVPQDYLEKTKAAVFNAGAGKIGDYQECCWQTLGTGQFRPLAGSNPTIGEQNQLTQIDEYKVEVVCSDEVKDDVKTALLNAHPYEEVAYGFIKIND